MKKESCIEWGKLIAALAFFLIVGQPSQAAELTPIEQEGRDLAFDLGKGSCIGCHRLPEAQFWGNIGPPLLGVAERLSAEEMRAQIWDPTVKNPSTVMWPFGTHRILTEEEIDKIVTYLETLGG